MLLLSQLMKQKISHFFAYLSRMKHIRRWSLMRNMDPENIQEHSHQVAVIAHALAIIRNKYYAGNLSPERIATIALFHDASEIITGDLPTPVKYYNPKIRTEYKKVEHIAALHLYRTLPKNLRKAYKPFFFPVRSDEENWKIIKAADRIAAYLKCVEELKSGNQEFISPSESTKKAVDEAAAEMPEVKYFMEKFAPSFSLALYELH
jgi:5'-deoxynucleotidase